MGTPIASQYSSIDLVPTILEITSTTPPQGISFDGEPLPDVLLGESKASRKAPIFFRRPPDRDAFYGDQDLPDLAVRSGKWKFLCEYDGSEPELYNMENDRGESTNVAVSEPVVVSQLMKSAIGWHKSMPADNGPKLAHK